MGEAGWPINTLCFELAEQGIINFKFLVENAKGRGYVLSGGINNFMIIYTHLISHNKYLEYYLLKKN